MYSQNKEEEVILNYFGDKKGIFLDVGANDGVTFSNTRALAEGGWRGVLIEPSPKAFSLLKENIKPFKGMYAYQFALGDTNGELRFMDSGSHLGRGDVGLLSTANEQDYNKWKASTQFEEITVKCFRYKTFMNRLKFLKVDGFDFISIDAEGYDLTILEQIDLRHTSCVCVEWNGFAERKEEFERLATGFKIIYQSGENLIFAR